MSELEIQIVGRVGGSLGSEIRRRLRAPWLFCSPEPHLVHNALHLKAHSGEKLKEGTLVVPLSRATLVAHCALHLKAHSGESHRRAQCIVHNHLHPFVKYSPLDYLDLLV